jgi:hypothetical protein
MPNGVAAQAGVLPVPRTRRMADRRTSTRTQTACTPSRRRAPPGHCPPPWTSRWVLLLDPFSGAIVPATAAVLALADHDRLDVALQQDLVKPQLEIGTPVCTTAPPRSTASSSRRRLRSFGADAAVTDQLRYLALRDNAPDSSPNSSSTGCTSTSRSRTQRPEPPC